MCYPRSEPARTYTASGTQNVLKKAASLLEAKDAAAARAVWGHAKAATENLKAGNGAIERPRA
jgi:hypothetical protein